MALPEMPPQMAQGEHPQAKGGDDGSRDASGFDCGRLPIVPAPTSAMLASEQESTENTADCGGNTPASFASYDPDTCSWKTSQRSLLGGWTEFSETWPLSGTMQNGRCFRRVPLVRLIAATESGLLPTPRSEDSQSCGGHDGKSDSLTAAVKMFPTPYGLSASQGQGDGEFGKAIRNWPTPHANCATGPGSGPKKQGGENLQTAVNLYPTPRASDYKGSGPRGSKSQQHMEDRGYQCGTVATESSGQLSPEWVELLMGFPAGWTSVD